MLDTLLMRASEALIRSREIIIYSAETWSESVPEAVADVENEMTHGREIWQVVDDTFGHDSASEYVLTRVVTAPQLTPLGVQIKARLWIIRSVIYTLIEEVRFVFSGEPPEWVMNDHRDVSDVMFRDAR